jgi:hypothetical protein
MRIWAQLHHENVVRLLGHTEEPEGPGLVSLLYPHGNVLSFLAKNPSVNREVIVRLHPYAFTQMWDPSLLSLTFTVCRCCAGIAIPA